MSEPEVSQPASAAGEWTSFYVPSLPSHLELRSGPYGLSAFANCDIDPSTVVLSLPYDKVLSEAYAISTPAGARLYSILQSVEPPLLTPARMCLYCVMIIQRDCCEATVSPFGPYLRSLPPQFQDPLWWSAAEIALLRGTNIEAAVAAKRAWLQQGLGALEAKAREIDDIFPARLRCAKQLLWAHSAFASRAFPHALSQPPTSDCTSTGPGTTCATATAVAGGDEFTGCLLPVLDILNHRYRTPIAWERTDQGLQFVVQERIPRGAEIFNNYGPKSNEEFLMGYGFVIPGNLHDTFAVKLGVVGAAATALKAAGLALRHECGIGSESIPRALWQAMELVEQLRCGEGAAPVTSAPIESDCVHQTTTISHPNYFHALTALRLYQMFVEKFKTLASKLEQAVPTTTTGSESTDISAYAACTAQVYVSGQLTAVRSAIQHAARVFDEVLGHSTDGGTTTQSQVSPAALGSAAAWSGPVSGESAAAPHGGHMHNNAHVAERKLGETSSFDTYSTLVSVADVAPAHGLACSTLTSTSVIPSGTAALTLPIDSLLCHSNFTAPLIELLSGVEGLALPAPHAPTSRTHSTEPADSCSIEAEGQDEGAETYSREQDTLRLAIALLWCRRRPNAYSWVESLFDAFDEAATHAFVYTQAAAAEQTAFFARGADAAPPAKRARTDGEGTLAAAVSDALATTELSAKDEHCEEQPLLQDLYEARNDEYDELYRDVIRPVCASDRDMFPKGSFSKTASRVAFRIVDALACPFVVRGRLQLCILPLSQRPGAAHSTLPSAAGTGTVKDTPSCMWRMSCTGSAIELCTANAVPSGAQLLCNPVIQGAQLSPPSMIGDTSSWLAHLEAYGGLAEHYMSVLEEFVEHPTRYMLLHHFVQP